MSTPVNNLQIVIKTMTDVTVGDPILTDVNGNASINLPPGEYKAIISNLAGYTFKEGVMQEPDESPVNISSQTISNITVKENGATSITGVFAETIIP